jgi:hypothetical protein
MKASSSMAMSPDMPGGVAAPWTIQVQKTDLVRLWAIVAITLSITGITYLAMKAGYGSIVPQLFYFPILYTAYFYPRRSIYVACSCAAAYLIIALSFTPSDPLLISGFVIQTFLFVAIAAGARYVLKRQEEQPFAEPVDETRSIRMMIHSGEGNRVEFKRGVLWSSSLTKEVIQAHESLEVKRYGRNAGKFLLAKCIASFLNTDGGDLLIGVSEDRINNTITVTGIEDDYSRMQETDRNHDGYRRLIIDAVIRHYLPEIFVSASNHLRISFTKLSGKTVCHIHILPSNRPVFVNTGSEEIFFVRIDASSRNLAGQNLTRYILSRFKS